MKVLHIYQKGNKEIAQYVNLFTTGMAEDVVCTDDTREFRRMCEKQKPDIIHLHGCKRKDMQQAIVWAVKRHMRLAITPHGQLERWEHNELLQHAFLKKVIGKVYAIIARSQMEADELFMLDANKRVEIIRNPIITKSISIEDFIARHRAVYEKMMNSNILEHMDKTNHDTLRNLLKAGITGDERWSEPINPTTTDWSMLFTYAEHEGIRNYIERGIMVMGINIPNQKTSPCYLPANYERPLAIGNKTTLEIVRTIAGQLKEKRLSLLSLAELDGALRRDDIEDDVLMEQLSADKLQQFFASLLTILHEQTGLDDGFMPCDPIDDRQTANMRTTIKRHLLL